MARFSNEKKTSRGGRQTAPSGVAPRKSLSQNFLTDPRTARRIVDLVEPSVGDRIVEIGPGTGALTRHLLETDASAVDAFDLDERVVDVLQSLVQRSNGRLNLHIVDILSVDPSQHFSSVAAGHRKVIGNIPYAITSPILFWLFEHAADLDLAVIMMQKEVARRCVAGPGTKDYGILSIASWYASQAVLSLTVAPGAFFPKPNVTSAVVTFRMKHRPPVNVAFAPFMTFVRAAFGQRRKVMTNALKSWAGLRSMDLAAIPVHAGVDLSKTRAEQLGPQELAAVYLSMTGEGA